MSNLIVVFLSSINRACACGLVKRSVERLKEQFPSIELELVNVDENAEAATAFEVRSIPTFVRFRDGKVVARVEGIRAREDLVKELDLKEDEK